MLKILLLDLDGVVNDHKVLESGHFGTKPECVKCLNHILKECSGTKIVITSAWRYIYLGGDMTLRGFEYLLLTHGVDCHERLLGFTEKDPENFYQENSHKINPKDFDHGYWKENGLKWRKEQILDYLYQDSGTGYSSFVEHIDGYVIIDDLDLDFKTNFVRTDGNVGLTMVDAENAIQILNTELFRRIK